MEAFWELSSCRELGFGVVGPIPWSAIDMFAKREQLEEEDFEDLAVVLRAMDEEFLRIQNSKTPKKTPAKPPARGGGGRR